jgi:uncharacterized protein YjbI with pentapeptide repeats
LFGAKLPGANLSDVDLRHAKLCEVNLSKANLARSDLSGSNLSRANLNEANLSRTNLSYCNLSETTLTRANLTEAKLTEVNLSRANLARAILVGADFSTPVGEGSKARAFSLKNQGTIWLGRSPKASIQLYSPFVSRRHAVIHVNSQGEYVLRDHNSTNGVFVNDQQLEGPVVLSDGATIKIGPFVLVLKGEDLQVEVDGTSIQPSCLIQADLTQADLRQANLSGICLYGANLSGVHLENTNLTGTVMPDGSIAPKSAPNPGNRPPQS